jgi:hypothetical protein
MVAARPGSWASRRTRPSGTGRLLATTIPARSTTYMALESIGTALPR